MSFEYFQKPVNKTRRIPYSTKIMPRTVKRARSSAPAPRAGGATKKFRSASVLKKKRGKRVLRGKKRSIRRGAGSSRAKFAAKVASTLMGDRTVMYSFVDNIESAGTTNAAGVQIMWSSLQLQTQGGVTILGERLCGHIDDPQVLLECMQSGTPATAISGAATTTSSAKATFTRMLRKSWKASYKITNAQSAPCEVWEYRCQARRDMSETPDTVLGLAFSTSIVAGVGSTVVPAGLPTSPIVRTTLGATPFMSNPFTRNYKIVKVKKRIIMPARWWQISYSAVKPRIYSYRDVSTGNDNSTTTATRVMFKGQRFSLFVASGTAASFSAADVGKRIGVSNVGLMVDQRVKVHYAMFGDSASTTTAGVFAAGFAATDGPQVPLPQVQNQPLYSIGTLTTANGAVQAIVTPATAPPGAAGGVDVTMSSLVASGTTGPFT